ncbi:zinc-dependent metalloprotease [Alloscardovia omnicolens]|uniref:zinc-dependent metalloprotease n=1 Tax=Alloscardovia omnicolens TaxID=419015 RepID=UPI003A787FEE
MDDGMNEEELHKWMISSFGPFEGEMAWQQFKELPEYMREQFLRQGQQGLPNPREVQSLMQAFTESGMNSFTDIKNTLDAGPINRRLAKNLAQQRAREGEQITEISAAVAQKVRSAASETNLWLDSVTTMDPTSEAMSVYTRNEWVDATLPAWIDFATPVATAMNNALSTIFEERFGSQGMDGEIAGLFAGPVNIPLPDELKDPSKLMQVLGNTSYAMQFGSAAGSLSREVRGTFDQVIALTTNPAGGIVPENVQEYAKNLDIDEAEVLSYLTLVESTHARLFNSVPWLMPQFKALISKYARSISIDLDAMEQELREAQAMNPESIAGAVNLSKVGMSDSPEQREALQRLETLLALVEGWVDCVVWRAGMPYLPHIEQLREMLRRERVTGGAAARSFEALLGMHLHPKKMREASDMWETLTVAEGIEGRDARWQHPDTLPVLADDVMRELHESSAHQSELEKELETMNSELFGEDTDSHDDALTSATAAANSSSSIDWDSELSELLKSENSHDADGGLDRSDSNSDSNSDSDTDSDADGTNTQA